MRSPPTAGWLSGAPALIGLAPSPLGGCQRCKASSECRAAASTSISARREVETSSEGKASAELQATPGPQAFPEPEGAPSLNGPAATVPAFAVAKAALPQAAPKGSASAITSEAAAPSSASSSRQRGGGSVSPTSRRQKWGAAACAHSAVKWRTSAGPVRDLTVAVQHSPLRIASTACMRASCALSLGVLICRAASSSLEKKPSSRSACNSNRVHETSPAERSSRRRAHESQLRPPGRCHCAAAVASSSDGDPSTSDGAPRAESPSAPSCKREAPSCVGNASSASAVLLAAARRARSRAGRPRTHP